MKSNVLRIFGRLVLLLALTGMLSAFRPLQAPSAIFVASIDPSYTASGGAFNVTGSVTIHDTTGSAVSNATVALRVIQPDHNQLAFVVTTNSDGVAAATFLTRLTGTFRFRVMKVVLTGSIYDSSLNVETNDRLTIPWS